MKLALKRRGISAKSLSKGIALSLCTILAAAGCSGGGSAGSGSPDRNQSLNVGGPDLDGNTFGSATMVPVGGGIVERHINTPGDVDFFGFDLVGGNLYGIQFAGLPSQGGELVAGSTEYSLLDGAGNSLQSIGSSPFPAGVDTEDGNLADMFIAPFDGRFFLRYQGELANDVAIYRFRISDSRLGVANARGDARLTPLPNTLGRVTNVRSFVSIVDDEGVQLFIGPALNRTEAETSFLTGSIFGPVVQVTSTSDGLIPPTFGTFIEANYGVSATEITFLDSEGVPEDDPQEQVSHIHWGIPSGDLSDGIDDTLWLDENNPTDNFRLDNNFQDGVPHPSISVIDPDAETLSLDLLHLIVSQDWYIDHHITTDLDLYPFPIVSSHPQGGIQFFDSAFVLNGFDTVPATGSTRTLEVVYNDEFQVFYMPYDVDSELAGSDIHVHAGRPGEVGEVILDLGTVPDFAARPPFESVRLGVPDFIPGVENIIKRLSNIEATRLRQASYTTGWYIDVHTEPFFVTQPEIRSNAEFEVNLEIASSTVSFDPNPNRGGALGLNAQLHRGMGDVSFVTETMAYGDITVVLNGEIIGELTDSASVDDAGCPDADNATTVTSEIREGTYYYRAYGEDDVVWEGYVTVDSAEGACNSIVLRTDEVKENIYN